MIWTAKFWKGAAERALKTFFQTFVAVLVATAGADAVGITAGLGDVHWLTAASVAGLAALLSLFTSVGNADFTAGKAEAADLDDEAKKEIEIARVSAANAQSLANQALSAKTKPVE